MENKLGLDPQSADNASQFSIIYTDGGPTTVLVVDESIDLSSITELSNLLNCSAGEINIIADPTPETFTLPLNTVQVENQSNDYGENDCKSAFIVEESEDWSKQVTSQTKTSNQSFQRELCTVNKARNFHFQIIKPNTLHDLHQESSKEPEKVGEMDKRQITSEISVQSSRIFSEFKNELGIEDGDKDITLMVNMKETKYQTEAQKLRAQSQSKSEIKIKSSEKEEKPGIFSKENNIFGIDSYSNKRSETDLENVKKTTYSGSRELKESLSGNRFHPERGRVEIKEFNRPTNKYEGKHRFKCTLCKESFGKIELLMKHRAKDHILRGKTQSFDCIVCGRSFRSVTSLHLHKRIHKRVGPIKCIKCEAHFTLKGSLLKHLPLCGTPAERKRVLKNKQRILREKRHANEDKIPMANIDNRCSHCNKCFSSQIALTTHKARAHKIVKPNTEKKSLKGFHVLDLEKCSVSQRQNLSFSRNTFWNVNHIVSETDWRNSVGQDQLRLDEGLETKKCTKSNCTGSHTNTCSKDLMKGKVFQCLYCRQCFTGAREVKKHVMVHQTICSDCGKKVRDLPRLRRHRLHVHNSFQDAIVECPHCQKKHGGVLDLLQHMKDHVGPWICERENCLAQFSERSRLVAHRKAHGNPYPDQAMSLFDGSVSEKDIEGLTLETMDDFIEKSDTFTETNIGRVQALVKCKICREQFTSTTITRKHIKMVHLTDSREKFQCDQCDFSTHFGYIFKRHQKKHRRPFVCNICGRSFDTKNKLDNHLPYHNKDRYQCFYCGKQFISRKKCIYHIKTFHTNKKKQSDKLDVALDSNDSFDKQIDANLKDKELEREKGRSDPDIGESLNSTVDNEVQAKNHRVEKAELEQGVEQHPDNAYDSTDVLFGESGMLESDTEMAHTEHKYSRKSIETREETNSDTQKSDTDLENVTYVNSCGQIVQYVPQNNQRTYSITPQTIQVPNSDVTLELYEDGTIVTKDTQGTNYTAINFESLGIDLGSLEGKTNIEFIIAQADGTEIKATIQADIDRSTYQAQDVKNELNHIKDDVKFEKRTSAKAGQNLYQCSKCPRTFKYFKTFQSHEEMHDMTHTCPKCQSGFATAEILSSHLELHKRQGDEISKSNKGISELNCSHCGKVFDTGYKLNRHIARAHELKSGYACPYCERAFRYKSEVQAHTKIHIGPFNCSFCVDKYTTRKELLEHVRKEHAFKTFICPICNAKCGCKKRFKEHVRQEHSERVGGSLLLEAFREYNCNECDAKFEKPSLLLRHQQRHTGKKPFACSFCSVEFYSKSKMNEHLRHYHWEQFKERYSYLGDEFLIKEDISKKKSTEHDKDLQVQNQSEKTSEIVASEALGISEQKNIDLSASAAVLSKPQKKQQSLTKDLNIVDSKVKMVCQNKKSEELSDQVMCDHCGLYFLNLKELNQHLQDLGLRSVSHVEDFTAPADGTGAATLAASDKLKVSGAEQQSSHKILREQCDKGLASSEVGDKSLNQLPKQEVKKKAKRGRKSRAKTFETSKAGRDDKVDLTEGFLKQRGRYDSNKCNGRTSKDDIVSFLSENFNLRKASSMLVKEVKSKPHKCSVCGARFSRESLLLKHMRIHDDNADIDEKIKTEHKIQSLVYKCEECGNMYATSSGLASHIRHKHPGVTVPAGVSKAYNTCTTESADGEIPTKFGKENRSSVKGKNSGYKYSTSTCRNADKSKPIIQKGRTCEGSHLKDRHSVNSTEQQTQLSPTKVSTSGRVIKKSQKTLDQIQCEICFKQFSFESYLAKHMQNKHPQTNDLKLFGKTGVKNIASLDRVTDSHKSKLMLHKCKICYKSFRTLRLLTKHKMRSHRSLNSSYCGHDVQSRKAAATHEMIHRRKEFECPECFKTFSWKISYNHHMRKFHNVWDIHIRGNKPLPKKKDRQSCVPKQNTKQNSDTASCHWSDNVKSDNPVKQLGINKEAKMTCNICNISFHRKRLLLEHMLSHTSIKSGIKEEFHQTVKKNARGDDEKKLVMLSKKEDQQNSRNKMKQMKTMRGLREGAKSSFKTGTDSALERKADMKCSLCTKSFKSEFNLQVHMLHIHEKITSTLKRRFCTKCKILFKTELRYTKHFHSLHGQAFERMETVGESPQLFKCEHCGESLRTSRGLKIHNKRVHGHVVVASDKVMRQECIMCLECQQLYKSEIEYKEHLKQFHAVVKDTDNEENIKREINPTLDGIKLEMADAGAFNYNLGNESGGPLEKDEETEFQCNVCNDVFTKKGGVKKHGNCHYATKESGTEFEIPVPESSEKLSNMTSGGNTHIEDQASQGDITGSGGKTYSEIYPVSCVVANVDTSLLNFEKLFGVPVVQLRKLVLQSGNASNSDDSNSLSGDDENIAESMLDSVESEDRNDQSTVLSEAYDTELELETESKSPGDEDKMDSCDNTSSNFEEGNALSTDVGNHFESLLNAVESEQEDNQFAIILESYQKSHAELELKI